MPAIAHWSQISSGSAPRRPVRSATAIAPAVPGTAAAISLGDRLAQRGEADRPAVALGLTEHLRRADRIADGAQPLEIGLAGEVEAVRLDRR